MNVNGIGAAGYPAWQGARKAESSMKGDFGANVFMSFISSCAIAI